MKQENNYSRPMGLTSQFRFCPNAFRIDTYKGCNFGCSYCFANITNAHGHQGFANADIDEIRQTFYKAFCTRSKDNLTLELLRQRVPLHCGGKSDPFQSREFNEERTYELIRISNKYNYPICFSTKTSYLLEKYYAILNPEIHAFQLSILGWSDEFIKRWEYNTSTAADRLKFMQLLRDRGFWVGLRIQPLIDLKEAIQLVKHAKDTPNYITVEHLKLPADNDKALFRLLKDYNASDYVRSPFTMRNLELRRDLKIKNIEAIKKIAKVPVGVGDNDLHHLSESRNCCGLDTIPSEAFQNFLKYNLTYFITGGEEDTSKMFKPKSSINECFYSGDTNMGKPYKQVVDDYIKKFPELVPKGKEWVLKKLNINTKKLF